MAEIIATHSMIPFFRSISTSKANKLPYEMYKAAEQEAEEMYAEDVLPRVDTVLTIVIGKVCNVPSVVANFRLVQKFKTKI